MHADKDELIKCATDPLYFITNYLEVDHYHTSGGLLNFDTYDHQSALLDSFQDNSTLIIQARQMGVTSIALAYSLWHALFADHTCTLLFSHNMECTYGNVRAIREWVAHLPEWLKPKIVESNKSSIHFDNGSKIIGASSPDYTKGISATLIFVDNMLYLSHDKQYELLEYITIVSRTYNKAIITSSLANRYGPFLNLWLREATKSYFNVAPSFNVAYLPWNVHPNMGEDFKVKMMKMMSAEQWAVEFECAI